MYTKHKIAWNLRNLVSWSPTEYPADFLSSVWNRRRIVDTTSQWRYQFNISHMCLRTLRVMSFQVASHVAWQTTSCDEWSLGKHHVQIYTRCCCETTQTHRIPEGICSLSSSTGSTGLRSVTVSFLMRMPPKTRGISCAMYSRNRRVVGSLRYTRGCRSVIETVRVLQVQTIHATRCALAPHQCDLRKKPSRYYESSSYSRICVFRRSLVV